MTFTMYHLLVCLMLVASLSTCDGFSTPSVFGAPRTSSSRLSMAKVMEIGTESAFDDAVKSAGGLVVINYSTTWCGPCKIIAPILDEWSEKYNDAMFVKVVGDSSPEAAKLLKREGVQTVPVVHFYKGGKMVDTVRGAFPDKIEASIKKNLR
mmetsp:Transcript_31611/g.72653  ORF Transcript_31611/g.72653 Transcript_31611/m.72653 type:complete len:152 (+) Transcript_31611:77-532(+)